MLAVPCMLVHMTENVDDWHRVERLEGTLLVVVAPVLSDFASGPRWTRARVSRKTCAVVLREAHGIRG